MRSLAPALLLCLACASTPPATKPESKPAAAECAQDADCPTTAYPLGRLSADGAHYCPVCPRLGKEPAEATDFAHLANCPKATCDETRARCEAGRCVLSPARAPIVPPAAESFMPPALPELPEAPKPFPNLDQPATKTSQCLEDAQCTLAAQPSCECQCNAEQPVNVATSRRWDGERRKRMCKRLVCPPCTPDSPRTAVCFRNRCVDSRFKDAWTAHLAALEKHPQALAEAEARRREAEQRRVEIDRAREAGLADR